MAKRYGIKIIKVSRAKTDGEPALIQQLGDREIRAASLELARKAVRDLVEGMGLPVRNISLLHGESTFQVIVQDPAERTVAIPLPGAVWTRQRQKLDR